MADFKATPEQWQASERRAANGSITDIRLLELRARIEQLEAQAGNLKGSLRSSTPPSVATWGKKTPMVRLCFLSGDPPAPHENWGDWFRDVLETRTLEGVCLRAIAPGDFSFDEGQATPPTVATDDELRAIWDRAYDLRQALRALYNLGVEHGRASSREVAEPAPVAGGLVERVSDAITSETGSRWASTEARAAILEVATFLREQGAFFTSSDLLEQEARR